MCIMRYKNHTKAAAFLLIILIISSMTACSVSLQIKADDMMAGITSNKINARSADENFIINMADFYVELFKETTAEKENSLISPLSVIIALSMTANGADNETLRQMEEVLGNGMSIDVLNEYLYSYVKKLPNEKTSKLNIANSIWFRDDINRLVVQKEFLQKNADYYSAGAYKSAFDDQTLKDINAWVKNKTDGMIDKILDEIEEDTVMYLINATVFDARWEKVYNRNDIISGEFAAIDDKMQTADFMYSEENIYLEDDNATGFIKPYADNKYSFFAMLPKEDSTVEHYIKSLSGKDLMNTFKNAEYRKVSAAIPKFSYNYTIKMNNALKKLGMPDAFIADAADFSKLGKSSRGNIYIGEVLHKSFISLDELGTKAGAVTKVEMKDESYQETITVKLNRPFVYGIIENSTSLPVFLGVVMKISE